MDTDHQRRRRASIDARPYVVIMKRPTIKLILSVKSKNWRAEGPDVLEKDEEYQKIRPKVLKEDDNTCRACGFKAKEGKWQEVHHLNDDHEDNSMLNLATLCSFCHMTQHIGFAGKNGEARLIWLPEISQTGLHHLVRTILVTKNEASKREDKTVKEMAVQAMALDTKLREREVRAKDLIGTNDPEVLGDILWRLANQGGDKYYPRREMLLNGIRLLPMGVRKGNEGRNVMADMITSWTEPGGPYGSGRAIKDWSAMMSKYAPLAR